MATRWCPCGHLGDGRKPCRCTPREVARYVARISGPLLDRIDLQIEVPALPYRELAAAAGESSAAIRARVGEAIAFRRERRQKGPNALLGSRELRRMLAPEPAISRLLEAASARFGLSARAIVRILRVARTIADLTTSSSIEPAHVAEAVQYRSLDLLQARIGG